MCPYPRISGRTGQPIILDNTFYCCGQPQEPFAVCRIEIYMTSVRPENFIAVIPIPGPDSSTYPSPLERIPGKPGYLRLIWTPPTTLPTPNIYFDKWVFIPERPEGTWEGCGQPFPPSQPYQPCTDPSPVPAHQDLEVEKCSQFWLYPTCVYVDDGLQTIRFSFEALDVKFAKGDRRPLEVGLQPLPLYDYDQNLVNPMIPMIQGYIHVETQNREVLVDREPMTMKLRQGSYRSNPFVLSWLLDTSCFLTGTYRYWVTAVLPNGQSIRSQEFAFSVSP